ncbi:hypothetical protein PAI11_31150 [Patulibacter medicamentivorans]|uniref:Uncharacterized protein n=1 Tax=Patulibacter medicamentivorans TaxID=1097667 RepID=H0E8F4_9ACTN|nr:hypothetical protein [Patulibacter medicamentivorans]EHN10044.1 hypothetical protein PAI11_31150 [Patulibacter medicamentivorans]
MRTTTTRRAAALTTCGLLLASGATATAAQAASYRGKTSGGSSIGFSLSGKRISRISTTVPTSCVETTGSFATTAGAELFQPPGSFTVGRTSKVKALQPAAMNQAIKATKNYTVTTRTAGRGRIGGKLAVNFSYLRPGASIYQSYVWICSGSASFTAKAR